MWRLREDGALVDVSDGFSPELVVDFVTAHRGADNNRVNRQSITRTRPYAAAADASADGGEVQERAARRRRGRVRRWCVANKASRLGTLTYAGEGQRSWAELQGDVARLRRRLKARHPRLALLTAYELHPGGHGWHVHLAMSGYVPQAELVRCWGRGFVHVEKFRSLESGREAMRSLSRYLAKYVSKAQEAGERPSGSHAYEVTQGTQPAAWRVSGLGYGGVYAGLLALLPGPVVYEWRSDGVADWTGPPAGFLSG